MLLSRRSAIFGLVALAAPAIIRTPGLLMPVKALGATEHWAADGMSQFDNTIGADLTEEALLNALEQIRRFRLTAPVRIVPHWFRT